MKCFFQLVNAADGTRTEAMGETRERFAELLAESVAAKPELAADIVIVLVDDVSEQQWNFSTAPIVTVATFISIFGVKS